MVEVDVPSDILAAMSSSQSQTLDNRPHFFDKKLQQALLVDSGSAVTVWPPEPGDEVDPSMRLKAVNGSRLNCYGFKQVEIQLGRKTLHFKAIKADVATPILGWDFIKYHKLNFFWNRWGDIVMRHRKSGIQAVLTFKEIDQPFSRLAAVKVVQPAELPFGEDPLDSFRLQAEVWAMQQLDFEETKEESNENTKFFQNMAESDFKNLLGKYPELLNYSFKTNTTKSGVIHKIDTGSSAPFRCKTRPLLAGSPKAVKGKAAWDQLDKLGIIERVNPSDPNNWISPLHLVPKADGSLRPTGDYRGLNIRTVLDGYPLPHIRSFTQDIAGQQSSPKSTSSRRTTKSS